MGEKWIFRVDSAKNINSAQNTQTPVNISAYGICFVSLVASCFFYAVSTSFEFSFVYWILNSLSICVSVCVCGEASIFCTCACQCQFSWRFYLSRVACVGRITSTSAASSSLETNNIKTHTLLALF